MRKGFSSVGKRFSTCVRDSLRGLRDSLVWGKGISTCLRDSLVWIKGLSRDSLVDSLGILYMG